MGKIKNFKKIKFQKKIFSKKKFQIVALPPPNYSFFFAVVKTNNE